MDKVSYYFNSIKEYYDYYTDPGEEKHIIGLFGNKVVDYINIFIRILIFIIIIFLILKKLPQGSGDPRHGLYFNLILLITIYQVLIYINQNWFVEYKSFMVMSGMDGCDEYDVKPNCPQGLLGIMLKVVEGIGDGILEKINFSNIVMVIVLGFILSKIGWPWQLALLNIVPFNIIQGAIYYIFLASKFSPIGFIFGTDNDAKNPVLIKDEHKFLTAIEMGSEESQEDVDMGGLVLKDLNTRFYVMYIVLLLLIFLTIIILITTNTVIDCSTYDGLLPLSFFKGCMGYRITIFINVIFFFGFSHDFIQSLTLLSEDETVSCLWLKDDRGQPLDPDKQLYKSKNGDCVNSASYTESIPMCNASHIIECKQKNNPLKGCLHSRNPSNNILKDLFDWQNSHYYEGENTQANARDTRIVVKKNSDGKYIIDNDLNKVTFKNEECRNSVQNWLLNYKGQSFEPYPKEQQEKDNNIKTIDN